MEGRGKHLPPPDPTHTFQALGVPLYGLQNRERKEIGALLNPRTNMSVYLCFPTLLLYIGSRKKSYCLQGKQYGSWNQGREGSQHFVLCTTTAISGAWVELHI